MVRALPGMAERTLFIERYSLHAMIACSKQAVRAVTGVYLALPRSELPESGPPMIAVRYSYACSSPALQFAWRANPPSDADQTLLFRRIACGGAPRRVRSVRRSARQA